MLDFNDVAAPVPSAGLDRDSVRQALLGRLQAVLELLLPAGKVRKGVYLVGDVMGSPGDSLQVVLHGDKAGLWTDRATGEGGDIFDLIAQTSGLARSDFKAVLKRAGELVGMAPQVPLKPQRKTAPVDELGPATAKWDYLDAQGQLLAVVYRYDPAPGKKEFRPWDARKRKMAPPQPRPLYNQPGMLAADTVLLVEGEKCAQALIDAGWVATTAMHGAQAPVDKTDWSPLAGKRVLIWPDKDKPGFAYAEAASQAVLQADALSCAILLPPDDQPQGWDAADALAQGWDVAGFVATGPRITVQPLGTGDAGAEGLPDCVLDSEDGLALRFTHHYHADWRYVAAWGQWLMWDGQRWRREDTLAATDLIRQVCRQSALQADSPRIAARLSNASTVAGVERLVRVDRRHAGTTDEWDADAWLLNTPGGVVDLRTGSLRPHQRSERMTKLARATPRSGAACPIWQQFIAQVTQGDAEMQSYLQRMFGYCLTGLTSEHALFFLYGTGANGKSVFVNTLFTILGDYAANAPMDTFMETRGDRHPTDLAGLRGSRFVGATETEQGRRWNESKIKEITGGDPVTARFMRQDFFTYVPQFKLVIAGNHKPAIRNIDEAMRRRLHLIPFTITVPPEKRDKHLQAKLLAEADGILAWGIEGCLQWQAQGLKPPQAVQEATQAYFGDEDALGRWLEERCSLSKAGKALTVELFADWRRWAEASGEFVGSQRRFSEQLINRGFEQWRNSMGLRGFVGLALKFPEIPAYSPYADN